MKKNKVIFSVIISAVLLILLSFNSVNAATSGDYEYEVLDDGTVSITKYNGSDTNVTIPSTLGGKTVTTLGEEAFKYNYTLQEVAIPSTITTMEYGVFMDDTALTEVTVPSSVTTMKPSAFLGCTCLATATINANIDTLPNSTFASCSNLKKVTLSSNITALGLYAFSFCDSLTDLSFLNGIENIKQQCFRNSSSITSVTIPSSVKTIGYKAFDSTVTLDLSKTRLVQVGDYYVVATKITKYGTLDYTKAFEVLDIVNKERAAEGLSSLTMDLSLLETAMTRAVETSTYFSHTRPIGLSCYSANSKMNGENIAYGYNSAESVMSSWMSSTGHKANILR